jgi:hypothetical protein
MLPSIGILVVSAVVVGNEIVSAYVMQEVFVTPQAINETHPAGLKRGITSAPTLIAGDTFQVNSTLSSLSHF